MYWNFRIYDTKKKENGENFYLRLLDDLDLRNILKKANVVYSNIHEDILSLQTFEISKYTSAVTVFREFYCDPDFYFNILAPGKDYQFSTLY